MRSSTLFFPAAGFNAAISACEQGGAWHQALAVYQKLILADLTPDELTHNAAVARLKIFNRNRSILRLVSVLEEVNTCKHIYSHAHVDERRNDEPSKRARHKEDQEATATHVLS